MLLSGYQIGNIFAAAITEKTVSGVRKAAGSISTVDLKYC